jgi:hypothetical protein
MTLHFHPVPPQNALERERYKSTHAQLLREVQQDNNYSDKREKARERASNFKLKGDFE